MRGGLRCASTMNGVQFVIEDGTPLMLKWSADNLDMELKVHIHLIPHTNNYKYVMTDIIITIIVI